MTTACTLGAGDEGEIPVSNLRSRVPATDRLLTFVERGQKFSQSPRRMCADPISFDFAQFAAGDRKTLREINSCRY